PLSIVLEPSDRYVVGWRRLNQRSSIATSFRRSLRRVWALRLHTAIRQERAIRPRSGRSASRLSYARWRTLCEKKSLPDRKMPSPIQVKTSSRQADESFLRSQTNCDTIALAASRRRLVMQEQTRIERIKVEGGQLIDRVKELIHEGNVRRVI